VLWDITLIPEAAIGTAEHIAGKVYGHLVIHAQDSVPQT